jgi:DeoR/GlpR family transcriptional regulator of sugar metabolism
MLELIRRQGFAALPDLAQDLEVSESTIRRDLDFLEEAGTAKRTHGGVFYTGPSPNLAHFDQRQKAQWDKKKQIGAAAAQLIEDADTILLDGGSTTYELARLLVGRPLQVVTNSLPVASLLLTSPAADLVLIGGYVHTRTGVSLGPYANQMLAELNVRRAVLSVAGINVQGCYNSNLLLVGTEKAMMSSADEVIVVADSTKFGRSSLAHLCSLEDIDVLVVDDDISEEWRQRISQAGVTLIIAKPAEPIRSENEQAT